MTFADALRHERTRAGLPQLRLALEARTSQRHISRLESGHVRPSQAMVLRLAQALHLSLRRRNHLLEAAGFAPRFRADALDSADMAALRDAVQLLLDHTAPNPALAADRHWNLYQANTPMHRLFAALDPELAGGAAAGPRNLMQWIWQPEGLRRCCRNWSEIAPWIWRQLSDDAAEAGSATLDALLARHACEVDVPGMQVDGAPMPAMLPLVLEIGGSELRLLSLIARFGSPSSATAEELRIETFIPADADSRQRLEALLDASAGHTPAGALG
ncbi:helix-turn-helix domain-containing protein [Algiphilus sp.]|uniref:helix-turn-helix domain-containing protein n=1 Tax=Algiphilus sp. TaxID=1872431 RepID=UPI003B5160DD